MFDWGALRYKDFYPNDKNVRIVINFYLAELADPIDAIVDTGAPWSILDPMKFAEIADYAEPLYAPASPLSVRGLTYTGFLYRIPMELKATIGESLQMEALFFVPDVPEGESWFYPNFIGLEGALDWMNFAVIPTKNLFCFSKPY